MSYVVLFVVLGSIHLFPTIANASPGHGFTYKYLSADYRVIQLECQTGIYLSDSNILMISIYNTTSMMKMAQVVGGKCPTIEDASNSDRLYLPGCSFVLDHGRTSLKVLITSFDSATVQTFICNVTTEDHVNKVSSTVWAVTVEKPGESTKNKETDYTENIWLPISAYKMIARLDHEVKLLEPSVVAAGVMLCTILFSLAVQMFLSCKIIRYLEYRRTPQQHQQHQQYQLSRSQSKMTDHSKSGQVEEEPFYASV